MRSYGERMGWRLCGKRIDYENDAWQLCRNMKATHSKNRMGKS